MSAPDEPGTDVVADKNVDNRTPDKLGADNGAGKTADNTPLVADSGADNSRLDNTETDKRADNKPPRGAIAAGVRSQLAVGVTDAGVITDRLSQALGLDVDKKTVARVVRREQSNAAAAEPEPSSGPYL
jgi:hypothetical protein